MVSPYTLAASSSLRPWTCHSFPLDKLGRGMMRDDCWWLLGETTQVELKRGPVKSYEHLRAFEPSLRVVYHAEGPHVIGRESALLSVVWLGV